MAMLRSIASVWSDGPPDEGRRYGSASGTARPSRSQSILKSGERCGRREYSALIGISPAESWTERSCESRPSASTASFNTFPISTDPGPEAVSRIVYEPSSGISNTPVQRAENGSWRRCGWPALKKLKRSESLKK